MSDLITVGESFGTPGLPGLIRFDYVDRERIPVNRGQYYYEGAPLGRWENLTGDAVTALRLNAVDADSEDQRRYLDQLQRGDISALIVEEDRWAYRRITQVPDYTYSVVSGLPPGMSFNSETRTILGTATTPGTYDVIIDVTDSYGGSNRVTQRIVVEE